LEEEAKRVGKGGSDGLDTQLLTHSPTSPSHHIEALAIPPSMNAMHPAMNHSINPNLHSIPNRNLGKKAMPQLMDIISKDDDSDEMPLN
jgi:hypothetical protein